MRIVQIIDSLEAGGAEKMAVSYANALAATIDFSGIVTTRREGVLQSQLDTNVSYLFLNKKGTLDFSAVFRLKKYCKKHKVKILQAHSSSYFIAVLVKLIYPKIKIVWHNHNGLSEFVHSDSSIVLKIASLFFNGIIVVNSKLRDWSKSKLYCKQVVYFPNFISISPEQNNITELKGETGKRIICLANLRDQKNHFFLIAVAKLVQSSHPDWSFHLVGKDFEDDYSKRLKDEIITEELSKTVFIYGSREDILQCIRQTEIAILTSKSEGLPLALLEYGLCKKPIVVTNVGEIPSIVINKENGFLVNVEDLNSFYNYLTVLINDVNLRKQIGESLHQTIIENYTKDKIINGYKDWISSI